MVRKITKFNPNGGQLTGKITNGFAHSGSYDFILWENDNKKIVTKTSGEFLPGDSCSILIPLPNPLNNGRLLECISTITIIPPTNNYNITLSLFQDGIQLSDVDNAQGVANGSSVDSDLFLQLSAGN